MARKVHPALHDILEAIDRVETITHDKTLVEFEGSQELRWLVHEQRSTAFPLPPLA
jgi:uncharacterized protein with HEPN domain